MKTLMNYLTRIITVISIVLSGCATSQIPLNAAKQVPSNRVFLPNPQPSASTAKVVFVRDEGLLGSALYQHVYINGEKAASLDTGEKVQFSLTPGEYILGVELTNLFGNNTLYSIDQTLAAGRDYHYRILIDGVSKLSRLQRYVPDQSTLR